MNTRKLTSEDIQKFHQHLLYEEKSTATVEKYLRDVRAFFAFLGESTVTKDKVLAFKKYLQEQGVLFLKSYSPESE